MVYGQPPPAAGCPCLALPPSLCACLRPPEKRKKNNACPSLSLPNRLQDPQYSWLQASHQMKIKFKMAARGCTR